MHIAHMDAGKKLRSEEFNNMLTPFNIIMVMRSRRMRGKDYT
jgi:hypothetical protein